MTGAIAKPSYFGEAWLPHNLYSVNCTGNESALRNCSYATTGACYTREDAGVICQGTTYNEKIKKMKTGRDGEKVKKQDGMSTIIVNYSDKIIRK